MTVAARLMLLVCFPWAGCILDLGKADLQPPPDAASEEPAQDTAEPREDMADRPEDTADPSEDLADPDDEESEPVAPYGTMDISFSTPFILDEEQLNESAYQEAHPDALIMEAAFTGTYGVYSSIPSADATTTLSFAYHSQANELFPARVTIGQQSSNSGSSVVNPLAGLVLMFDDITVQTYPVDITEAKPIQLLVYNVVDGEASSCVLAIGIGGILRVSVASGTTAQDGGTLALTAVDLPLYYPTQTPHGDMTETFQASGITVCPRE